MIVEATGKLIRGASLTYDEAASAMTEIMDGEPTPAQFGSFVTALRMKGETADEIAGMGAVMRQRSDPSYFLKKELPPSAKPYRENLHEAVPERVQA